MKKLSNYFGFLVDNAEPNPKKLNGFSNGTKVV
jgi:hypothetical protein